MQHVIRTDKSTFIKEDGVLYKSIDGINWTYQENKEWKTLKSLESFIILSKTYNNKLKEDYLEHMIKMDAITENPIFEPQKTSICHTIFHNGNTYIRLGVDNWLMNIRNLDGTSGLTWAKVQDAIFINSLNLQYEMEKKEVPKK